MTRVDLYNLGVAIMTTLSGVGLVLWAFPVENEVRAMVGATAFLIGLFLSSLLKLEAPPPPPHS